MGGAAVSFAEKRARVISILEATRQPRLIDIAAWVRRTGKVTTKIIRLAAFHVATCDLCGKKALYRYGLEGRCSAHKSVVTAGKLKYDEYHNARGKDIVSEQGSIDKALRERDRLKGLGPDGGLMVRHGGSR